jgi:hypothetical protein
MKTRSVPAGRVALTAAFVVLALALVPVALAGKPGGGGSTSGGGGGKHGGGGTSGGSSSLALVMVNDANGNGGPNYGDTITFKVTTSATAQPYVEVTCSQNGTTVYSAWAGFYAGYLWPAQQNMPLTSPAWTGGAASCVATLNTSLAKLSFSVGA